MNVVQMSKGQNRKICNRKISLPSSCGSDLDESPAPSAHSWSEYDKLHSYMKDVKASFGSRSENSTQIQEDDVASSFPDTREPSLEPLPLRNSGLYVPTEEFVADPTDAHGRQHPILLSNCAAPCGWSTEEHAASRRYSFGVPLQPADPQPVAQAYPPQLLGLQDQPVFGQPDQVLFGHPHPASNVMFPMSNGGVVPWSVHSTPAAPDVSPEPELPPSRAVSKTTPNIQGAEQDDQAAAASSSTSSVAKKSRPLKGNSIFNKMPTDQKEALCKYIYDLLVARGFTTQEGHLLTDVFSEVWQDIGDTSEGRQAAQFRFTNLLRSAPGYFNLYRRKIRVAKHSYRFAREGELLVRLVLTERPSSSASGGTTASQ
jgi:hypothetical protein